MSGSQIETKVAAESTQQNHVPAGNNRSFMFSGYATAMFIPQLAAPDEDVPVVPGSFNARVGRSVIVDTITSTFRFSSTLDNGATNFPYIMIRCFAFHDLFFSGDVRSAPDLSQLFIEPDLINSHWNPDFSSRFVVLYDRVLKSSHHNAYTSQPDPKWFDRVTFKVKREFTFSPDTGDVDEPIVNATTGNFYTGYLIWGLLGADIPQFDAQLDNYTNFIDA